MTTPSMQKPTEILNNFNYALAKQSATIILPAIGTLYFMIAGIWGLPYAEQIVGTVAALNLFVGVLVGVSKKIYESTGGGYDGTLQLVPNEEGTAVRMLEVDPIALLDKDRITFKIINPVS